MNGLDHLCDFHRCRRKTKDEKSSIYLLIPNMDGQRNNHGDSSCRKEHADVLSPEESAVRRLNLQGRMYEPTTGVMPFQNNLGGNFPA